MLVESYGTALSDIRKSTYGIEPSEWQLTAALRHTLNASRAYSTCNDIINYFTIQYKLMQVTWHHGVDTRDNLITTPGPYDNLSLYKIISFNYTYSIGASAF